MRDDDCYADGDDEEEEEEDPGPDYERCHKCDRWILLDELTYCNRCHGWYCTACGIPFLGHCRRCLSQGR